MNINKEEASYIIKPIAIILSIIILLIAIVVIGMSQVKDVISRTNDSQKVELSLNQKVSVLQKVFDVLPGDTTFLDVVVPSRAAVLYGLSQVKNQALKYNLVISNLKTGSPSPVKDGIYKSTISLDIDGDEASVYSFLDSFSKTLPLMNIDKVKLNKTATAISASTTLTVFSAQLPKTIPSVTTEASTLSTEEITLLKELSTFDLPIFSEPKPQNGALKTDPFN